MDATGPHRVEMEGWIRCAPFERLLNMEIIEASGGQATLTMPFRFDLAQGGGLMHGGALVSLADTAVAMAIKSLVPQETDFATMSLEARFLYPVTRGIVTAKAVVTSQNERILHGQTTIFNDAGRPVLEFSSIFKIAKASVIRGTCR
jgi:acyl-CoA thioesterase